MVSIESVRTCKLYIGVIIPTAASLKNHLDGGWQQFSTLLV